MQAVARRRARQAAADHGAALPVDRVPPCAVSRARRQPMAAAARAATALMPAKPPVAMPIVRRPFMPEAMATSPQRHTAVSTVFWPLLRTLRGIRVYRLWGAGAAMPEGSEGRSVGEE